MVQNKDIMVRMVNVGYVGYLNHFFIYSLLAKVTWRDHLQEDISEVFWSRESSVSEFI